MAENNDNTNRGVLFKNDRKTEDKHPDYRGTINVNGVDKDISAWIKLAKSGVKYLSIAASDPYVKPAETAPAPVAASQPAGLEDDNIPF